MSTSENSTPAAATGNTRMRLLAVAIFLISAVLMLFSSRGDLAIDEVMSWSKAIESPSWGAIFTQDQNDNNHLLNTCIMRAFGDQRNMFLYRLPAVAFGLGLLALTMISARRLGPTVPLWAGALVGFSYPIVLYSSEARGYAAVMFFSVAAFELLQRNWEKSTPLKLVLFWAALIFGFLAHFSFVMVALALGAWSLLRDRLTGMPMRTQLLQAVKFFAVPLLFAIGLYLFYIRHMRILGGNVISQSEAVSDGILELLGFAEFHQLRLISAVLASALGAWALWKLYQQRRMEWVFFLAVIVLAPAATLILWHPTVIYFRYFCVTFPFFYLLLASLLGRWAQSSRQAKLIAIVLLAAISCGHLIKIGNLIAVGRGNYKSALMDIAAATGSPTIEIGSDHDFRNGWILYFYSRFLPADKKIHYIPKDQHNTGKPEWMIVHCLDPLMQPYPDVEVGTVGKYDLWGVYPYCGASGWSWFIYRREAATNIVSASMP